MKVPLGSFNLPSARFSHVPVDLVWQLPVSSGFRYCLKAIDRYIRWPEAVPLLDITAEAVTKAFVSVCVARFGCPQQITAEQGRQFEARLFKTGYKHQLFSNPDYSVTSLLQWHDRETPSSTESRPNVPRRWTLGRSSVVDPVALRSAWKEDYKVSWAELVYGSPLRLPGDFFAPSPAACTDITDFKSWLRTHIGKLRSVPASRHAAPSALIFKDLATASHFFLRHGAFRGALQATYVGPYRVLHRSEKTYTINVQGAAKTVSIDRLKPANVLHDDTASASSPAIPSSLTSRYGRQVHFPDYLWCSGLSGGVWWTPEFSPSM